MATATAAKPMELEGSLKAFKFPEILQFLGMGRMTGVLSLEQEKRSVKLCFHEGKITSVASSDRYLRLGQMLVYAGRLSRRALDEAVEYQERSRSGKLLGQILVEKQLVQPDDLRAAVRLQIEEEVWELFRWDDGNFRFEQGARGAAGGDVALDVEPLLLEGSRRLDEWQAICANIDDPNEVYRVNPDLKGPPEGKLDASTWRVLSLVDGKLSVDAIVRLSNLGRFETYWALAQLLRADLIVSNVGFSDPEDQSAPELKLAAPGLATAATQILSEPFALPAGAEEKQGLFGALLGKLKGGASPEPSSAEAATEPSAPMAPGEYLTDVSLVCAALNHAIDCLEADPKFFCDPQTPDALKSLWFETTQRYPKCDLVRLRGRRLHAENYERYAKAEGALTRALGGAHDDSLEGLRRLWAGLAERARGRGEDSSQTLARAMRPYQNATARMQAPGFALAEWMKERD